MQKGFFDRKELVTAVAEQTGHDEQVVLEVVKSAFDTIAAKVGAAVDDDGDHKPVVLHKIGVFSLAVLQSRRYVINGKEITKDKRYKVVFDPAEHFTETVQANLTEAVAHIPVL